MRSLFIIITCVNLPPDCAYQPILTSSLHLCSCCRDYSSWESVNRDFMHRLQPVTKKDEDEYWISMEDFR